MPRRSLPARLAPPLLFATTLLAALGLVVPDGRAAETARHYAVASESGAATREASELLERGGNAIDAAICAALVAGVASPSSSGIGGGGFALVWSARDQRAFILDFRETAPQAVEPAAFENRPFPEAERGRAVGTPGEIAGLFELHQRWGKTRWPELVQRAARVAEQGFAVEAHLAEMLGAQKKDAAIARAKGFGPAYFPGGAAAGQGQRVRVPRLAATLRLIAREGRRGFYEGAVARDLVNATRAAGGALQLSDLQNYQVKPREPLAIDWEGKRLLTMPAPSAGGLLLAQTLQLFTRAELLALSASPGKRVHLLAEAMRGAFADRARYFGDPELTAVDVDQLLSPARLARRKARLAEDRTHTQPRYGLEEAGTHHLAVADQAGNWVSLTTTVNASFGAKLVAEASGVVLNNQLDDFTAAKNVAVFNLKENPNRPRPGARPVSSMSPTLLLEGGEPVLAIGGSGGTTIGSNVTQVLLARLVNGASLLEAVSAPRFFIPAPRSGHTLWLEPELAARLGADLSARGELWQRREVSANAVQVIAREAQGFAAASDPRKRGVAKAQ